MAGAIGLSRVARGGDSIKTSGSRGKDSATFTTRERDGVSVAVEPRWARWVAQTGGVVFLAGAAINVTVVALAPQKYADLGTWMGGPEPLARLWAATLGEHPRVWVPIVGVAYEAAVGLLALSDGRRHRLAGMTGIAAFHVGLLVMGGWSWALPVLAIVVPAIVLTAQAPRGNGLQP